MKTFFLVIALLCFSLSAVAADSGLYYNTSRSGEGLSLHRDGDLVAGFFFTYGGDCEEVVVPITPYVSPAVILSDPLNGQRWFMISGDLLVDDTYAVGLLYQTGGVNYPLGLSPNGVGAAVVVGEYLLERSGDGWSLTVTPTHDTQLALDDPLFTQAFNFSTTLLSSGD